MIGPMAVEDRSDPARVSVVVLTHNEGDMLRRTVESIRATVPASTEIVVVDDGSTDGSTEFLERRGAPVPTGEDAAAAARAEPGRRAGARVVRAGRPLGISAGRNFGAWASSGDIVVFSDAHVEVDEGWLEPLVDALADPAVAEVAPTVGNLDRRPAKGYGFTWPDLSLRMKWLVAKPSEPTDVPFICGCFLAVRRDLFQAVGGFDEGMYRWGSEDAELSLRFWLLGYRCQVVPSSRAYHLFRDKFPYQVDSGGILSNTLRLGIMHFDEARLERLVRHHARRPAFGGAWTRLLAGDAWQRRAELAAARQRDFPWFVRHLKVEPLA
jgi:GT2 family glycosyltransferase